MAARAPGVGEGRCGILAWGGGFLVPDLGSDSSDFSGFEKQRKGLRTTPEHHWVLCGRAALPSADRPYRESSGLTH